MPKKPKTASLLIVLKKSGSTEWRKCRGNSRGADSVIHISPGDLKPVQTERYGDATSNLRETLGSLPLGAKFDEVTAIGEVGRAAHLEVILEELMPYLADDASISIVNWVITARSFERLVTSCEGVILEWCRLLPRWWTPTGSARKTSFLAFWNCVGSIPNSLSLGESSWPALKELQIEEGNGWSSDDPTPVIGPQYPAPTGTGDLTPILVKAFWNEGISCLRLDRCQTLEFLVDIPASKSLKILGLSDSPTSLKIFDWILSNRFITHLGVSWQPSVRLPWAEFAKLRKLRSLEVIGTPLDDEQLAEIATHVSLRSILMWYTAVTAKSWTTILNWPTLRSCWGSREFFDGEVPELPQTTNLKEFVAMNANRRSFEALLARYPEVKVVEM